MVAWAVATTAAAVNAPPLTVRAICSNETRRPTVSRSGEDADLCFRLRRIGLKTLYQPAARVIHHEGMSHGRDTSVGIKSYQVANRRAFIGRWADVLAHEHFRNGNNVFRARDRAMHRRLSLSSTITSQRRIAMPGRA